MKKNIMNILSVIFLVMISIIPISIASASDVVSVSYGNETWTFNQPEYYGYKYGMFIHQDGGSGYEFYFLSNEPLAYSTSYVVISTYDDVVVSTYKYKQNSISTNLTLNNFSNRTGNYGLNMANYKILWSNYDVPEVTFDTYNGASTVYYSTGNISHACNADSCVDNVKYEHTIELNPNDYNYFYLKFHGIGDLQLFFKQYVDNYPDACYYYPLYKNGDLLGRLELVNNNDTVVDSLLKNSLESDVYTLVIPFFSSSFEPDTTFTFHFTVPGLIEYGTNEFKYTYENDDWVEGETDRSDITDLLEPSDNVPNDITSSVTSNNSLSNDSLNEFMWPYSLFARNGNNIKNIKLTGSYSSTFAFNINDFKTNLIINYGDENYKININNCISMGNCNLTAYEQKLIKNILFDRNVENTDYYLDFSVVPQKDATLSISDQFNFGISLNFSSSIELTINSLLLAINDLSNSYYNVYFKLYDSSGKVHTIYKTSLDNSFVGVNQFKLDSRTADIYQVDLMFVYNHTQSTVSKNDNYSLKFSEFNIFANTEMIHIYTDNTNVSYQTCAWYDGFCHIQNGFTWLVYEAPFASDFWKVFLYITNTFDILWTLVTYIFMPFDIIPPIFGVPISSVMPFLIFGLYLIKKLWFGGD